MKNQDSAILKWQKILVEIMTVWIVMVASSIFSRTEPNIVGFFIWLGIAIGIYAMVRIYFKHQLKYIYLLFLAFPLAFFWSLAWVHAYSVGCIKRHNSLAYGKTREGP